jgi:F0F1-type ATP synthase membrane subunit b/b'
VITLEGWSTLMYNYSDASPVWMAETFFIMLVLIGSFFLLNVILAVIMDTFDEVASQEGEKIRKKNADLRQLKKDYDFEVSESDEIVKNSSNSSSEEEDSKDESQSQEVE